MTNKKTTKRALIMSVLSLFLCFTMMLGTTYAWFTDSVTSSGNKIMAGTLDIDLFMHNDDGTVMEITDAKEPLFGTADEALNSSSTLWEPGKTQVVYLSLVNNGSLDLKYKVNVNVTSDPDNLREVMSYAITPDAENVDGKRVGAWDDAAAAPVVLGINATQASTVELKAGETHYFALSLHMDEEAGNEYQGKTMEFDIVVFATQLASELDSFGPDYDEKATYDDGAYVVSPIVEATFNSEVDTTFSYENEEGTFKVEGKTLDPETEVKVTVIPTANTNEMNTVAAQANSTALSYDIKVEGQKEDSEVYVEFFLGKNLANVKLFHEGDPIACDYVSDTGMVSFTTTSFSVYTATYSIVDILPLADVSLLTVSEMPAAGDIAMVVGGAQDVTLDVGYKFVAKETAEEAAVSEYRNWHADFVISFDKDVAADSCGIAGNYGTYGWLGFCAIDIDDSDLVDGIPANTEIRLLYDFGTAYEYDNPYMNYHEICDLVESFKCGAFAIRDEEGNSSIDGTTLTVELRLYETYDEDYAHEKWGNHSTNYELGHYHAECEEGCADNHYEVIGRYKYTFGK